MGVMDGIEALINKLRGINGPDGSASQKEQDQFDAIQLRIDEGLANQLTDDTLRMEDRARAIELKKEYNAIKKGARKRGRVHTPNKLKVMNKGGMTMRKGNMAYNKGGMGKSKTGHSDYRKGGMVYTTKGKK